MLMKQHQLVAAEFGEIIFKTISTSIRPMFRPLKATNFSALPQLPASPLGSQRRSVVFFTSSRNFRFAFRAER